MVKVVVDLSAEELLAKAQHDEEAREIVKSAINEWLDDRFKQFGRWTAKGVAAAVFGALVWWLVHHGYRIP